MTSPGRLLAVVLGTVLAALLMATGSAAASPAAPPAPTPPAAPAPAAAPAVSATPCAVTAKACLDLGAHRAWLTDGAGHITYGPVTATGGMRSAPTPVGSFHVLSKSAHYHSREFDAPMPNAVFFYPGDAFHEDSTKIASNGCVHLSWSSSQRFFDSLRIGDPVQVVA